MREWKLWFARLLSISSLPFATMIAACDGPSVDPSVDAMVVAIEPDAGPPEELDAFIDYQMRAGGIPGLAAAITTPDGVVLTITRGAATDEREVDEHTLFALASISKPFVATLIMQLVTEGSIDLDAPIDDYLPYAIRNPSHPDDVITTRMLLSHTSSLSDDDLRLASMITSTDPTVDLRTFGSEYVANPDSWLPDRPARVSSYCNACFGVLGDLIEQVSGETVRARSEARIFAPLALDGAGWFMSDLDASRLAQPYGWSWNDNEPYVVDHITFPYYPAGTLHMSITGLSRFVMMLARSGELDGSRVLEEDAVAEMRTPPFPRVSERRALGLQIDEFEGRTWAGHSGETLGASTRFFVSLDDGVGLILLTNSDAYLREEIGMTSGVDALKEILRRLDREATRLVREPASR